MTVPSDSVASYLLWKHLSSPLHWGQQRKGSSLKCVECQADRDRLAKVPQHCLLHRLPSPGYWWSGKPGAKESLSVEQSSHTGEMTGSCLCHHSWSQLAISRSRWCSPFRAKRTRLDSHPAAMGEGCWVVSSKPDDSGFKHNRTFLSRYGNAYTV